jgi:hypothetical protein
MEGTMIEVSDFSKYTDVELRKLLIDNAKPIAGGMSRVVREITKKYNACDREMMLWFIKRAPYYGKLWAPDCGPILTVAERKREEARREREMERMMLKRRNRPKVVHPTVTTVIYPMRKATKRPASPIARLKAIGCKPVLIAEKTVGIVSKPDAAIREIKAAFPDWMVVEV